MRSGTGKFFEVMAKTLNFKLVDFASLRITDRDPLKINSLCTVFAESEVISLLARGENREEIAYALHKSVVNKVSPLLKKIHDSGDIIFCGGCAKNSLLHELLEKEMGQKILIPKSPQLIGAYGASIIAFNTIRNQPVDTK